MEATRDIADQWGLDGDLPAAWRGREEGGGKGRGGSDWRRPCGGLTYGADKKG